MAVSDAAVAQVGPTSYDAYGRETRWSGTDRGASGRFAGQKGYVTDDGSGMQLLGARYYLPALGRFLTQDPIGHEGGLNLYAYCDNNPVLKVDPDGLQAIPHTDVWFINHRGNPLGSYGRTPHTPLNYNLGHWISVAQEMGNPPFWLQALQGMAEKGISSSFVESNAWYVLMVRPGGRMDFKHYENGPKGKGFDVHNQELVDYGNFNAGVIGRAIGFDKTYIMWGGGLAARYANGGTRPFSYPTYGDQPRDNFFVQMGIQWYDRHYRSRR